MRHVHFTTQRRSGQTLVGPREKWTWRDLLELIYYVRQGYCYPAFIMHHYLYCATSSCVLMMCLSAELFICLPVSITAVNGCLICCQSNMLMAAFVTSVYVSLFVGWGCSWLRIRYSTSVCVCVCVCLWAYLCAMIKVYPCGCSFSYWLTDLKCACLCVRVCSWGQSGVD